MELLSGKSSYKEKDILKKLSINSIDIIFGTHALFQKKLNLETLV